MIRNICRSSCFPLDIALPPPLSNPVQTRSPSGRRRVYSADNSVNAVQQSFLDLFGLGSDRPQPAAEVAVPTSPPDVSDYIDEITETPPPPGNGRETLTSLAPTETQTDGHATHPTIIYERSLRARHYRLTLRRDGVAIATIPMRGSEREARAFVAKHTDWLERARARQRVRPRGASVWSVGAHVLWRGDLLEIRKAVEGERPKVCLGADVFRVARLDGDLRPTLEAHFQRLARIELPARTWELAAVTGMSIREVSVRNQRTRWGSCTTGGVISLNWRLIQTPDSVRDYIIYHELMHLKEMNHSARFWARVEEVCPAWRAAELWLKRNGSLLGL
ncbi:M48 family peptidase [Opitutaceae bacterium TAV4]|nr:M48 family peptidase [Opitutaceae bacterium TAV4]RRJ99566.1 M48 family peptidase [Opitutaceae bacterium TAV3]